MKKEDCSTRIPVQQERPYRKPELTRYQKLESMTRGDSPPQWSITDCEDVGACAPEPQPII